MNVAIIGAGLAGLGAAWNLQNKNYNVKIFEKEIKPGGLCRTIKEGNFLFDYTGHLLHFNNSYFKKIVFSLIGDKLVERNRSAWIYSKNVFTKYPFQANLYGLPVDTIVECIYEYGKQHFSAKTNYVPSNFEELAINNFGEGIAKHFLIPYNKKIYKSDPKFLHPDCNGRFFPQSDLKSLIKGALTSDDSDIGYNATFFYPQEQGIELLVRSLAEPFDINVNEKVDFIDTTNKIVHTSQAKTYNYDYVISTQPVTELINSIDNKTKDIVNAVNKLKYVSILNINIGVKNPIPEKHWVYIPEGKFIFHRVGFTHNFSPSMTPKGYSSIYLEVSYDPAVGIDKEFIIEKCINECIEIGFINKREEIEVVNTIDIPYGYVIFDFQREKSIEFINNTLESKNIFTAGRFGSWVYSSMEDAFMDGYNAAEKIGNMG